MFNDEGGFATLNRDQLYGAKIEVTVTNQAADGQLTTDVYTYYQDRWVDVVGHGVAPARCWSAPPIEVVSQSGDESRKRPSADITTITNDGARPVSSSNVRVRAATTFADEYFQRPRDHHHPRRRPSFSLAASPGKQVEIPRIDVVSNDQEFR